MAKINILPAKVYNRIAAGEVIERPFSVVKELIENSIDAGATEIEIYVEKGGTESIRVVDNGCGIDRDDLQSAFLPHATSKISTAEDLDEVLTLGFRGEAIASIASVSHMSITSRVQGGKCYQLICEEGNLGQIEEVSGPFGTEVCVDSLFCNAPVRLKFLKKEKGEEAEITNVVSRFILDKDKIAFTYYVNGKKVLQSFGGGMEEAMVSVYGAATLRECFHIDATVNGVRVYGYISNQNYYKGNKSYQSVFLNGRYIVNGTIASAISNAYNDYLMKRQYPFYVLHVEVPREVVDVNVHPNKADVRFADNQTIYGSIFRIISSVLDGNTKALEYVVQDANTSANPVKTSSDTLTNETIKTVEQREKEGKTEEKPTKTYGFSMFTYEEAQREIEKCAPSFTISREGEEVPFGEVATKNKKDTSYDETPDYEPQEGGPGPSKRKTPHPFGAEKLHKQFPDLYFERNYIRVEEPENADSKPNPLCLKVDGPGVFGQRDYQDPGIFEANKRYLEELDKNNRQGHIDVYTCRYAGKLFNTYLLFEKNDEVFIIDQHAAHERLIYNRLKEQIEDRKVRQQPMLVPFEMQLNAFEGDFIRERMEDIREMGFDIFEDGENLFKVTAVPLDLQNINMSVFFNDILGYINNYRSIKLAELIKDKLASAACKAAVKGGMDLTEDEIDELFQLMDGDMGLKCPHGRPVVVTMSKKELEKKFKRIV